MTLPVERTRALLKTEALLKDLLSYERSYSRAELRVMAGSALRHYPTTYDIERLAEVAPDVLAPVSEVA
jgi:hypothetical protein